MLSAWIAFGGERSDLNVILEKALNGRDKINRRIAGADVDA